MVVGGGAGGMGTVNKFVNKFGQGEVCLIDPAAEHFNQSQWTLVGKVLLCLKFSTFRVWTYVFGTILDLFSKFWPIFGFFSTFQHISEQNLAHFVKKI